jgi:hypothetical protein
MLHGLHARALKLMSYGHMVIRFRLCLRVCMQPIFLWKIVSSPFHNSRHGLSLNLNETTI